MHENPLVSVAFLSADDPLHAYIDERYLTRYKTPVSGRLGMPGLERLVQEAAGERPRLDTAYLFITKGNRIAKILIRDEISTNLLDLHGSEVTRVLELCEQLGI